MGSRYEFMPNERTTPELDAFIFKALLGIVTVLTTITLAVSSWTLTEVIAQGKDEAGMKAVQEAQEKHLDRDDERLDALQDHRLPRGSAPKMDENIITPPQ
jgi:hypothetical protein